MVLLRINEAMSCPTSAVFCQVQAAMGGGMHLVYHLERKNIYC